MRKSRIKRIGRIQIRATIMLLTNNIKRNIEKKLASINLSDVVKRCACFSETTFWDYNAAKLIIIKYDIVVF